MKRLWRKGAGWLRGRDKGTVAVTFMLALPLLLAIFGMLVQYALLLNARVTVDRAVQAAARSAMTAMPTDQNIGDAGGATYPIRAALMTLESLSPQSPNALTPDSTDVAAALTQVGANPSPSYAARYTYAQQATQVTIQPLDANGNVLAGEDYAATAAPRARVTVQYSFMLTVPLLKDAIGRTDTVAGITGRFITITSSLDVQLSHGREAPTDGNGVPQ